MPDLTTEPDLLVEQEITVAAAAPVTFAALIAQLGEQNTSPDGKPMPMTLEAWPGGRWFRDLGEGDGHLWGHVQVIRRPTLLEIVGPMFMSYAAVSHLRFRLTTDNTGTLITLRHQAIGPIQADHREGVNHGWKHYLEEVRNHAERQ